jgi:hypothetical protein
MSAKTISQYSINVLSQRDTESAHLARVFTFRKSAQRDVVGKEPPNPVIAIGPNSIVPETYPLSGCPSIYAFGSKNSTLDGWVSNSRRASFFISFPDFG